MTAYLLLNLAAWTVGLIALGGAAWLAWDDKQISSRDLRGYAIYVLVCLCMILWPAYLLLR